MAFNYVTNGDQNVVLGSGDLYAIKVSEVVDVFNLTTLEEADLTYLGYIESDAELKSSAKKIELTAANAGRVGTLQGQKTVSFSTGIFSWNLDNVSNFLTGSSVTTDVATGKKTFIYAEEDRSPRVYLRFVSTDTSANKKITVNMLAGEFAGELALNWNSDSPITFDYSFDLSSVKDTAGKHQYYQIISEDIV